MSILQVAVTFHFPIYYCPAYQYTWEVPLLPRDHVESLLINVKENGGIKTVPFLACRKIASDFGMKPRDVETAALKNGICPERYRRNIGTIGINGQMKLLGSRAAVIGCGGLGGWIIELLARAGVGEIVMVDPDVFDENNLNRQLFSTEDNIGKPKAIAAASRVAAVNGAVETFAVVEFLDEKNGRSILEGSAIAIDALDNNKGRRNAYAACCGLGIPFVHGAIGGMFGQVGVFYPGDRPLWENDDVPDKGIETETGNPPFTPAFVASLEVSETVKVLTASENGLKGELIWFDLAGLESQRIKICPA
ncbi:MAG TPA: thiamine biosynthesis protein ThiF [Synergistaceae bacterium]|jgi:molybdopterin/thiamine biosynthesis adenylyltransferase|nr:thiamine biosynthesis protein ThiF [Synergistaceae bacterium]